MNSSNKKKTLYIPAEVNQVLSFSDFNMQGMSVPVELLGLRVKHLFFPFSQRKKSQGS